MISKKGILNFSLLFFLTACGEGLSPTPSPQPRPAPGPEEEDPNGQDPIDRIEGRNCTLVEEVVQLAHGNLS